MALTSLLLLLSTQTFHFRFRLLSLSRSFLKLFKNLCIIIYFRMTFERIENISKMHCRRVTVSECVFVNVYMNELNSILLLANFSFSPLHFDCRRTANLNFGAVAWSCFVLAVLRSMKSANSKISNWNDCIFISICIHSHSELFRKPKHIQQLICDIIAFTKITKAENIARTLTYMHDARQTFQHLSSECELKILFVFMHNSTEI